MPPVAPRSRSVSSREMGHPEVPVACGSSEPLAGDRAFPAEWRARADSAYGLPIPAVEVEPGGPDAVDLLTTTITASPSPVHLLTLGGLTNVAEALNASPELAQQLEQIVIMGGALEVPGNVTPAGGSAPLPVEWNLYVDPTADVVVLESGAPITFVSLDAYECGSGDRGLRRPAARQRPHARHHVHERAPQLVRASVPLGHAGGDRAHRPLVGDDAGDERDDHGHRARSRSHRRAGRWNTGSCGGSTRHA